MGLELWLACNDYVSLMRRIGLMRGRNFMRISGFRRCLIYSRVLDCSSFARRVRFGASDVDGVGG